MYEAKRSVMRMLDVSGRQLLKVAQLLSDEQFFRSPTRDQSVAWTFAHLAALEDWSVNKAIHGTSPKIDGAFREAFKGGRPMTDADESLLLARAEMVELFSSTREFTIGSLSVFDSSKWDERPNPDCRFGSLGEVWENLATDSYWHLGFLAGVVPQFSGTVITLDKPRVFSVDPDSTAFAAGKRGSG